MNRSREELLTVLKKRQLQQQQMGRKSSRLVLLAKILTLFSIVAATYTYFLISMPTKASRKNDILLERYVQTETVAPAFEHFDGIDHPVYDLARTDEKYSGYIYLDWILSSDDFDYINYKALESLLVRYHIASTILIYTYRLVMISSFTFFKLSDTLKENSWSYFSVPKLPTTTNVGSFLVNITFSGIKNWAII